MSRRGFGYKLLELMHTTRKGKERVVENNHITVEEVDDAKKRK